MKKRIPKKPLAPPAWMYFYGDPIYVYPWNGLSVYRVKSTDPVFTANGKYMVISQHVWLPPPPTKKVK